MTAPELAGESDSMLVDVPAETAVRRERLRFAAFTFKRSQSAFCTARTELEWEGGQRFVGMAEGVSSPVSDLRLAAEATVRAVAEFVRAKMSLDLLGVKALRVFDANVVIVSILARRGDKEHRLLGCHLADEDVLRSAALATLQATNRLVEAPSAQQT